MKMPKFGWRLQSNVDGHSNLSVPISKMVTMTFKGDSNANDKHFYQKELYKP